MLSGSEMRNHSARTASIVPVSIRKFQFGQAETLQFTERQGAGRPRANEKEVEEEENGEDEPVQPLRIASC